LRMDDIDLYWKQLLLEYHKLFGDKLKKPIVKRPKFVQVQRR